MCQDGVEHTRHRFNVRVSVLRHVGRGHSQVKSKPVGKDPGHVQRRAWKLVHGLHLLAAAPWNFEFGLIHGIRHHAEHVLRSIEGAAGSKRARARLRPRSELPIDLAVTPLVHQVLQIGLATALPIVAS